MTSQPPVSSLGDQLMANAARILPPENWVRFPILVAVSGGPDSVALLRVMIETGKRHQADLSQLIVAHVNHGIRREAADHDESFVSDLARQSGLNFQSRRKFIPASGCSEEKLRKMRYLELADIAHEVGARYIAMGHTADDQLETILFRIFRGTGMQGIPAIRLFDDATSLVRPLLTTRRQLITQWLDEIGQDHCSDPSNQDLRYSRNFLRHHLLPQLRERFGESVFDSIQRLGQQATENQQFLSAQAEMLWPAINLGHVVEFDCEQLRDSPTVLVRHLLVQIWNKQQWPRQSMSFPWWQTLAHAITRDDADQVLNLPHSLRFERKSGWAKITALTR